MSLLDVDMKLLKTIGLINYGLKQCNRVAYQMQSRWAKI